MDLQTLVDKIKELVGHVRGGDWLSAFSVLTAILAAVGGAMVPPPGVLRTQGVASKVDSALAAERDSTDCICDQLEQEAVTQLPHGGIDPRFVETIMPLLLALLKRLLGF